MNGVSCLQVTPQRAQLIFGENIFTFRSLMSSYPCWLTVSSSLLVLCCVWLRSSWCCVLSFCCELQQSSKATGRAWSVAMAACVVLTSWSWYLTKPVQLGFTLCDGASIVCDLRWWLHLLLASSARVNPFLFSPHSYILDVNQEGPYLYYWQSPRLKEHSRISSVLQNSCTLWILISQTQVCLCKLKTFRWNHTIIYQV